MENGIQTKDVTALICSGLNMFYLVHFLLRSLTGADFSLIVLMSSGGHDVISDQRPERRAPRMDEERRGERQDLGKPSGTRTCLKVPLATSRQ